MIYYEISFQYNESMLRLFLNFVESDCDCDRKSINNILLNSVMALCSRSNHGQIVPFYGHFTVNSQS